jgi:cytochrome c peroxidase
MQSPEKAIAQTLVAQVDSFSVLKNKLLAAIENGNAGEKQLQELFIQTRLAYKKFE